MQYEKNQLKFSGYNRLEDLELMNNQIILVRNPENENFILKLTSFISNIQIGLHEIYVSSDNLEESIYNTQKKLNHITSSFESIV